MSSPYEGRRALITGGHGFLAAHLGSALLEAGAELKLAVRRDAPVEWLVAEGHEAEIVVADLRDRDACRRAFRNVDFVFHLAAVGWGFHENRRRPSEVLAGNLAINTNVIELAGRSRLDGLMVTSSSSVYPQGLNRPAENLPLEKPPHPGEAPLGWAKRMAETQARFVHEQTGLPIAIVRPSNPYGPWDCLDLERSHVIPALINRALNREAPFRVRGSGRPIRSFIHARDVARGMLAALEHCADASPVNASNPQGTTIAELVTHVLELTDHRAEPVFDRSFPDGPPIKLPDASRLTRLLDGELTRLEEGLTDTIDWMASRRGAPCPPSSRTVVSSSPVGVG
ncbi:MAG: NAD-dependent epimerase/dehydratase family protein [Acidobacteriota bacterium]